MDVGQTIGCFLIGATLTSIVMAIKGLHDKIDELDMQHKHDKERIWEVLNGRPFGAMRDQAEKRKRKERLKRELASLEHIR